jgi:hypothetical protein
VFGLRTFALDDLPRYREATIAAQVMGWAYYAPYLLSKDKQGRSAVLIDEDDGILCLYQWQAKDDGARLDLTFPPLPMDAAVLRRALERCHDYNGDTSARIMRIDERDVAAVQQATDLEVRERRTQYVFSPATYTDLAGRRLRTLRRQIALFDALEQTEFVDFDRTHIDACRGLLRRWKRMHREAHGTAGGTAATRRALELAGRMEGRDLFGELVYFEGRLVGFAFGGEIRPGLACFFDAKSDAAVPGLSYAHRLHFLRRFDESTLINDGSDARRPGLRQLKHSFRPVSMHLESRGRPRRR